MLRTFWQLSREQLFRCHHSAYKGTIKMYTDFADNNTLKLYVKFGTIWQMSCD